MPREKYTRHSRDTSNRNSRRSKSIPSIAVGRPVMVEGMKPAEFSKNIHETMRKRLSPAKKNMYKIIPPERLALMYVEPEIVQTSLRSNGRLPKPKAMRGLMANVIENLRDIRGQTSNPEDVWVPLSKLSVASVVTPTKTGKTIEQVVAEPAGLTADVTYADAFEDDGNYSPYGVILKERYDSSVAILEQLLGRSSLQPFELSNGLNIPFLQRKGHIPDSDLRDIQRGASQCLPRTVQLGDPFVIMNDGSGRPPLVERVTES